MIKKFLAALSVAAVVLGFAVSADASSRVVPIRVDTVVVQDTVQASPTSIITLFGPTFVSAPGKGLFDSPAFSKASMLVYQIKPGFSIGMLYGGVDFNATNLTEAEFEQFGAVGIYHDYTGWKKLGFFVTLQMVGQTFDGGPTQFASVGGLGLFYPLTTRFAAIGGISTSTLELETKSMAITPFIGLETNLR